MISLSPIQSTPAVQSVSALTSRLLHRNVHHLSSFTPLDHHQRHSHRRRCRSLSRRGLLVRAIDAAHPYDLEEAHKINRLKIAIIGFGNFGQFLAKAFIRQGHTVYAHSRSNYHSISAAFFSDPHDLCDQHPDVMVICTSINSIVSVLGSLPLQRLKPNTLFVDVLSVKEFPRKTFLEFLPSHFDILCTHPMFGPQSGKHSWQNLPFMFDKVRIGDDDSRVEKFLDIFNKEGCRMVEMSCEEHDKYAEAQFITHTIGRTLGKLQLKSTPINTKGYESLLDLVDNTESDSFDLYYGLYKYNENSKEQLERLDSAFQELKKELLGFEEAVVGEATQAREIGDWPTRITWMISFALVFLFLKAIS